MGHLEPGWRSIRTGTARENKRFRFRSKHIDTQAGSNNGGGVGREESLETGIRWKDENERV